MNNLLLRKQINSNLIPGIPVHYCLQRQQVTDLQLHWWMQRRANDHLAVEVLSSLYFLSPPAVRFEGRTAVLPFNYAEVKVMYENICFTVARGRGEVNVSLSPRHSVRDTHQLATVISVIESRHLSNTDIVTTLEDAVSLIRPRVRELNEAFSEAHYREFQTRL